MSTVIALHNSVPAERSVGGGGSVEGKSLGGNLRLHNALKASYLYVLPVVRLNK